MGVFAGAGSVAPSLWHKTFECFQNFLRTCFLCIINLLYKHLLVRPTLNKAAPSKQKYTIMVNQIHGYNFGGHRQISGGPALQTSIWIRQCSSVIEEVLCKQLVNITKIAQ